MRLINATQTDVIPSIPTPVEEAGLFAILVFMVLIIVLGLVMVLRNNSKAKLTLSQIDAKKDNAIMGFAEVAQNLLERDGKRVTQISKLQVKVTLMASEIDDLKTRVKTCVEIERQSELLKRENAMLRQQNTLLKQENERLKLDKESENV